MKFSNEKKAIINNDSWNSLRYILNEYCCWNVENFTNFLGSNILTNQQKYAIKIRNIQENVYWEIGQILKIKQNKTIFFWKTF